MNENMEEDKKQRLLFDSVLIKVITVLAGVEDIQIHDAEGLYDACVEFLSDFSAFIGLVNFSRHEDLMRLEAILGNIPSIIEMSQQQEQTADHGVPSVDSVVEESPVIG